MRQSHILMTNAAVVWACRALLFVPQILLVPFLLSTVGAEGYGVYALILPLFLSLDQLHTSLQQGVVKHSAAYLAQGRMEEASRVVSASFAFSLGLAVLASLGVAAAALAGAGPSPVVRFGLWTTALLLLLALPLNPYVAVVQSRQRYYATAIADTGAQYAKLALVFLWFRFVAPSVEALLAISMGVVLAARLAHWPLAHRYAPGLRGSLRLVDRRSFGLVLAFGGAAFFLCLCNVINGAGMRWLMGSLVSTRFVGHLAIILMPSVILSSIVLPATTAIMPAASGYDATGNSAMLRALLVRGTRYITLTVLAALLAAGLLLDELFTVWVGAEYSYLASYSFTVLASVGLQMTSAPAHHLLKGMGQIRRTVAIASAGKVVVPVALAVGLLIWLDDPYLAVSAGLVAGNSLAALLTVGFAMSAVAVSGPDLLRAAFGEPLAAAFVSALVGWGVLVRFGLDGLVAQLAVAACVLLLFGLQVYVFYANAAERRQALHILRTGLLHARGSLNRNRARTK